MRGKTKNRNVFVEAATTLFLDIFDKYTSGEKSFPPTHSSIKKIYDDGIFKQGGSVKLAQAFFVAYSLVDPNWNFTNIPVGTRGVYGDKKISNALTQRHVTFHGNITAFGENLGWKGDVSNFDLTKDKKFSNFLSQLKSLEMEEKEHLLNYVISMFHASRSIPEALPKLDKKYLTYARSLSLCNNLLKIKSEGHIQQFLVAAFLAVHRNKYGHLIKTHHPHAADKFDGTTGDIEEFRDDLLVAAYEVTVRDDWKNRISDFQKKSNKGSLSKYIIFASNVRGDASLFPAENLVKFVADLNFDLAIVDISDFFSVFCAELQSHEIIRALNKAYEFICEPSLCGRKDIMDSYKSEVDKWLDNQ